MTKRKDVIAAIRAHAKANGLEFTSLEGANHTRVWVGSNYTTIPRHKEIPDAFARKILKQIGVES